VLRVLKKMFRRKKNTTESINPKQEQKNIIQNPVSQKNIITVDILQEAFPQSKKERLEYYYSAILQTFEKFDINTPERKAAFLSQCAHESGNFNIVVENLNYSSEALMRVWPRHFTTHEVAQQYHRQPERIANRAYANRMGNGPESSGDGWKYRGRGLIQITGRNNYTACSKGLGLDLINNPELLEKSPAAVLSAGWFWNENKLNLIADTEDITLLTRRINGGVHGLQDRLTKYQTAIKIFRKYLV